MATINYILDKREDIIKLHLEGASLNYISQEVGVHRDTIKSWLKRWGYWKEDK